MKLITFLFWTVINITFVSFMVVIHEDNHVIIYEHDGCKDIVVKYWWPRTWCADENFVISDWAKEAHSINEIVQPMLGLIFVVLLGIMEVSATVRMRGG